MDLQQKIFLFSIDLEDVRRLMPDGNRFMERVPEMVDLYLAFLKKYNANCTFFVVGDQIRAYPNLIKKIMDVGHEIACHTNTHIALNHQTAESFKEDIERFLESAYQIGANDIKGFRAPIFSLTEKTSWAYSILKSFGFTYSSSVLPAKNPLYGWESFGNAFKTVDGIFEMPISIHPKYKMPLAGGVYLRLLPFFVVKKAMKELLNQGLPLQNYLHPYDIDTKQEHFMHPGINNSKIYNFLMYYNRKSVFTKLEKIMELGVAIAPYKNYVATVKH